MKDSIKIKKQITNFISKELLPKKTCLESLLNMKYEEKYYLNIHKLELDPFYIFYWTPI